MNEADLFLSNAKKLRELHDAVHAALAHRDENPGAWEEASRRFHSEYDSLAFLVDSAEHSPNWKPVILRLLN